MSFATVQDLQARFGVDELRMLADRDGDGVLDAGVVEAHLQDADAEIMSHIGLAVSQVDPANPPLNLKRIACDIARYRLYGANPNEDARARYKDAVAFLRLVAENKATLDGGAAAPGEAKAPSLAAATDPGVRIFKRGL
ncbi:gp436 family protein [Phenylobacterium sp.]|uniref:gp436 family protein n=1 Tax=Phenylobacterium sp. TaxID=1871053 RepID=UPI003919D32A